MKEGLLTGCRILDNEGVTDGFGHLSVRVPGQEAFWTLARVSPRLATAERLVLLDFEGRRLAGAATPATEWPIHARLLRARPEVMSVCHSHSPWSVLFSVVPTRLRPLHQLGGFLPAAGVPVYEPAGLIRTVAQGDALAAALGQEAAVLLRGHGDAVVGGSIEETVQRAIRLARLAELAHLARLHGEPRWLSEADLRAFDTGGRDERRGWDYYVSRLPARRRGTRQSSRGNVG
jgi:ribulose-5-phosphate 4-epimerase/fuculose-1-phosphate aldolase